ncbi:LOW QUALITY PROTEIN: melanopsin-B-like [Saccoglossus kowalevskii]
MLNVTHIPADGVIGLQYDEPGHPFMVFYIIIQSTFFIGGTVGNILVLAAFSLHSKLRTVSNIFIISLAISDLAVTGFVLPFNVVGILKTHHFFRLNSDLCEVISFVCVTSCIASLWNIMAISVNRYIHICKSKYKQIFSFRNTILMCILIWIISALVDLPNFMNWGGHRYDMKTLNHREQEPGCHTRNTRHAKLSKQQKRLLKMIFAIFAVFILCWVPYGIVVLIDFQDRLSQTVHIIVWVIAHASAALDPVIYAVTNKRFQQSMRSYTAVR